MKNIFILCSLSLLLVSSVFAATPHPDLHTDDFFIVPANSSIFQNTLKKNSNVFTSSQDCRAHIADIMCLVEPRAEDSKPRECIVEDLSISIQALQKVFDVLPAQLAAVFCKLDVLYVERNFIGTAYARMDGTPGGKAVMGIRESALKGGFSLAKWISWKEQLSFGGDPAGYGSRDDLVKVEGAITLPNGANDFLFFVIAHEFGHIMDFSHSANQFACSDDPTDPTPCLAKPGSWSALSWDFLLPLYEPTAADPWGLNAWQLNSLGQFTDRNELCFYACAPSHGSVHKMVGLYNSLQQSNLLTTYSATNSYDDFAEATAFWAMAPYKAKYVVSLPSGERHDLVDKFQNSVAYSSKRKWLENFYSAISGR